MEVRILLTALGAAAISGALALVGVPIHAIAALWLFVGGVSAVVYGMSPWT
jgi:hypothetical protein